MIQEETTAGCEASILHFEERDELFRITRPGQYRFICGVLMSADEWRQHDGGNKTTPNKPTLHPDYEETTEVQQLRL